MYCYRYQVIVVWSYLNESLNVLAMIMMNISNDAFMWVTQKMGNMMICACRSLGNVIFVRSVPLRAPTSLDENIQNTSILDSWRARELNTASARNVVAHKTRYKILVSTHLYSCNKPIVNHFQTGYSTGLAQQNLKKKQHFVEEKYFMRILLLNSNGDQSQKSPLRVSAFVFTLWIAYVYLTKFMWDMVV